MTSEYTIEVADDCSWAVYKGPYSVVDGFATDEATARDCAELVRMRLEGRDVLAELASANQTADAAVDLHTASCAEVERLREQFAALRRKVRCWRSAAWTAGDYARADIYADVSRHISALLDGKDEVPRG